MRVIPLQTIINGIGSKRLLQILRERKNTVTKSAAIFLISLLSLGACGSAKVATVEDPKSSIPPPSFAPSEIKETPLEIQSQSERGQGVSVTKYGANGQDSSDDTVAFQRAFDELPASGGSLFIPAGTYRFSTTLHLRRPVAIKGAGQNNVRLVSTGQGFHLIEAERSLSISDLQIERADISGNLHDKGISFNFSHAPGGTPRAELGVDNVTIKGFDTGIYVDGGPSLLVPRVRVTRVHVETNRLSTATQTTGYTPTVNVNNADEVVVSNCELIQPRPVHINNIYMIGSERVLIRDNTITNGIGFKEVSGQIRPVKELTITNNHFQNSSLSVLLISESQPFEQIVIDNNQFLGSRVLSEGSSDIMVTTQRDFVAKPYAYRQVKLSSNTFRDVARGVVRVEMGAGNQFGTLVLDGNSYERWGTLQPRSFNLITTGAYGTYDSIIANHERVDGGGAGRAYIGESKFRSGSFGEINERNVTMPQSTKVEASRLGSKSPIQQNYPNPGPENKPSASDNNGNETELRRLAGRYLLKEARAEANISVENGQLVAYVTQNPRYILTRVSETDFRVQNSKEEITFHFDLAGGRVKSLTMKSRSRSYVLTPAR